MKVVKQAPLNEGAVVVVGMLAGGPPQSCECKVFFDGVLITTIEALLTDNWENVLQVLSGLACGYFQKDGRCPDRRVFNGSVGVGNFCPGLMPLPTAHFTVFAQHMADTLSEYSQAIPLAQAIRAAMTETVQPSLEVP